MKRKLGIEKGIYTSSDEASFQSDKRIKRKLALKGELPSLQTPLPQRRSWQYWSARFRLRQEQYKEAAQQIERNHVEIAFKGDTLINFIGDIHAGAIDAHYERVEQEVETIVNTPNSFVIVVGDLVDGFFFNPAQFKQIEQTPEQWSYTNALLRYLADNNKLLIGFGGDHDCLDDQTELLTKRGWLKYNEIKKDDIVLSYDVSTGNATWSEFNHIIKHNYKGKLYSIETKAVSMMTTGKHRHFYKNRIKVKYGGEYQFKKIQDVVCKHNDIKQFILAGDNPRGDFDITDNELRLIAWFLTDGGKKHNQVAYYQSKPEGVKKIRKILDTDNLSYSIRKRNRKRDSIDGMRVGKLKTAYEFVLTSSDSNKILSLCSTKERLPSWVYKLSKRQFDIFLNSLIDGDGSRKGKSLMFYQHKKKIIDDLQALCVMNRYRASIYKYRNRSESLQYRLNIYPGKFCRTRSYKNNTKIVDYDGVIWDLTIPVHHNFLVRRNGKAYFTGNSWPKKYGIDPYSDFADDLGAYYMQGIGHLTAEVDEQVYKLTGTHRLPGFSMYNNVHPQMRASKEIQGADIYFSAHTHTKGHSYQAVKQFGGSAKNVHFISLGPYKSMDDYSRKRGWMEQSPNEMFGCSIILRADTNKIDYFHDILEASSVFTGGE